MYIDYESSEFGKQLQRGISGCGGMGLEQFVRFRDLINCCFFFKWRLQTELFRRLKLQNVFIVGRLQKMFNGANCLRRTKLN